MKVSVGIPARMGSARFPGKPLCKILGMSMVEHVYRRCMLSNKVDQVFVATCDEEIRMAVENIGGTVIMTSPDISRPGLRVAEACKQLELGNEDIVVVVQGDEPLVRPEMIDLGIQPLLTDPNVFCVNLVASLSKEGWLDPNEIKVACDLNMNAIYMSRSPIPSGLHPEQEMVNNGSEMVRLRQVCIFPFRKKSLLAFNELPETPLELAESIEMLRAIEHGYTVRLVHSPFTSKSVDTETDRLEVERLMSGDDIYPLYAKVEDCLLAQS